jgi:uncharacterized protein
MSESASRAAETPDRIHIFPLNAVLFPGGVLPLKIFEQRYIEMTKVCLSENRPFGICLIKEGRETGTPAVPEEIGCYAHIRHWDMPQLGVFHLQVEGAQRFRILQSSVERNGLISAEVAPLPGDSEVAPADTLCAAVLRAIIDKLGAEHFPSPHRFDDAAWISYRLGEVLPISLDVKQQLLQQTDPQERLAQISTILAQQGLRAQGGLD